MLQTIQRLLNRRDDENGASAVEYGLLVAAIAAIIVVLVFVLGGFIKGAFKSTCDNMKSGGITSTSTNTDCSK